MNKASAYLTTLPFLFSMSLAGCSSGSLSGHAPLVNNRPPIAINRKNGPSETHPAGTGAITGPNPAILVNSLVKAGGYGRAKILEVKVINGDEFIQFACIVQGNEYGGLCYAHKTGPKTWEVEQSDIVKASYQHELSSTLVGVPKRSFLIQSGIIKDVRVSRVQLVYKHRIASFVLGHDRGYMDVQIPFSSVEEIDYINAEGKLISKQQW